MISKPQILQPDADNRAPVTYTVKAGDTVDSIAAFYGLSPETVKWANSLTSSTVTEGRSLTILPIDGIQYTVKAGDTLQSIGEKYGVDQTRVVLYNDLDESGIVAGQKLILPNAVLPNTERPGYVAPVAYAVGYSAGFSGNTWRIRVGNPCGYNCGGYAFGYCTAYVWYRRVQMGLVIGTQWGNANTWDISARAAGLLVDNKPSVGAIMQNDGGYGHAAVVEKIFDNGDLEVSEMNALVPGGGWNIVSGRIISAANVSQYLYIH